MSKVLHFIHKVALSLLILLGSVSIKPYSASAQGPADGSGAAVPLLQASGGANATLIPLDVNLLQDPSFESSLQPGGPWVQYSQNFGTPLAGCNGGFCNARTGNVWAWFGGTPLNEEGWIYQNITIPQCGATLYFFLSINASPGSDQNDLFRIIVDGSIVFEANATQANSYSGYTWVSIDLNQYAGGGVHSVQFYSFTTGQAVSFNLDDVAVVPAVGPGCAGITVRFAGSTYYEYGVPFGTADRVSYAGVNSGPVEIWRWGGQEPIIASERVAYFDGTRWTSFSEMMGLPYQLISKRYYFPWYNNKSLNTQLRFGSRDTDFDTIVTVKIGGILRGTYNLSPNTTLRVSYPQLDSGPVVIESSSEDIIASERVAYLNPQNNKWTGFSEMIGLPTTQLSSSYWFPWYNNTDFNAQLRFGNVDTSPTTITVWIGGLLKGTYVLAPNASQRVAYPANSGPVLIQSSGAKIIASLRVGYTPDNGATWPAISETMGLPGSSVRTRYYFPWYNNIDLNTQLRFANVGNTTTTVTVWIGGAIQGTYALAPHQSTRQSYAVNSGPVLIESSGSVPIIASERVAYFNGSRWTSFSEMMGLPGDQLSTYYIFPWYNNVDFNTQFRFAVPIN